MGSLNDYGRDELYRDQQRGGGMKGRLLRQTALAAVFFLAVAAGVGGDGAWGTAARYVAGAGLAADSSWLHFSGEAVLPVQADTGLVLEPGVSGDGTGSDAAANDTAASDAAANDGTAAPSGDTASGDAIGSDGTPDANAIPTFTAPASGVVVTDLAVTSSGFASQQGVLIQGSPGQNVRSAAAGQVLSLSGEAGAYVVELSHSGGFTSLYQGLSQVEVGVGDRLSLGDSLGVTDSGELIFSLLRDGAEVDPLEYLFN